MSTESPSADAQSGVPIPVGKPVDVRELARLLIKHYGLTEGEFDLMIRYQVGTGAVGPDKESQVPGLMIGVAEFSLVRSREAGPNTVDAATVNPAKKRTRKP